jgi:glutamate-1-semialdehyde 2,1-aminomutase
MRRFHDERPADISFARGTFNSHPYVMGAMQVFLETLEQPQVMNLYRDLDDVWSTRARILNERLQAAQIPVQIASLSTIWTVSYGRVSRYNWMLQFYLRAHGLALSWVGTGRIIFSLNFTDVQFNEVADRFVAAATQMNAEGWWAEDPLLTNRSIRRQVLEECVTHRMRKAFGSRSHLANGSPTRA